MNADRARILVVDDEPNIRKMLAGLLEDEGYAVAVAEDAEQAQGLLEETHCELLLLDVMLPGMDGLAFLRRLREEESPPPIIMMSGHGTIQTALDALRLGALDFIEKPIQPERLLVAVVNALRMQSLSEENADLKEALAATDEIIGSSRAIAKLREEIARSAPTDARVLITGENGTGKELVARGLHAASRRRDRPFIKINCAAIPSELLESELFGHEKGAFTGAVARRRGKFERAQGGTLLLDEIGDMNPMTQAKLLRVLEDGEMERLGGERSIALDVRIFSSTNRDLDYLLREGGFREDLYHRLKVVPIHVPPLREHAEDVDELATHFLALFCAAHGRRPKALSDAALQALRAYAWPGNVRELKNLIERLVIMTDGNRVEREQVSSLVAAGATAATEGKPGTLADSLEAYERRLLETALADAGGNVAAAARGLGLDRANLHRKLQRLGLRS